MYYDYDLISIGYWSWRIILILIDVEYTWRQDVGELRWWLGVTLLCDWLLSWLLNSRKVSVPARVSEFSERVRANKRVCRGRWPGHSWVNLNWSFGPKRWQTVDRWRGPFWRNCPIKNRHTLQVQLPGREVACTHKQRKMQLLTLWIEIASGLIKVIIMT